MNSGILTSCAGTDDDVPDDTDDESCTSHDK